MNDRTPAFPVDTGMTQHAGMSLRDYFAAKALQGLASDPNLVMGSTELASLAYKYADAMIEARK